MIWLKRFLMVIGALALILLALAGGLMDFSKDAVHQLPDHPNAQWQGAADGGHYIEVTRAEPPYFFVQVRYESGSLWSEGWLKYDDGEAGALTASQVLAFDGDGVIYLQQRKVLASDKSQAH
ncbi:hypothetical protein GV818_24180 [Pseudomonas sp. Fl4BN1]|nr:hypothetical protein [Pseudomonas sp. Fl4BN1]